MEYQEIVRDFADRTKKNLNLLREIQANSPDREIFEVTQLVNSMLGLLVFPQQSYVKSIPEVPLSQLREKGWPVPRIVGEYPQVKDLNQLVRYLRNAIAHFNVRFLVDDQRQINGLQVWNVRERWLKGGKRKEEITWKAELSLAEIETITYRFIDLMLEQAAAG